MKNLWGEESEVIISTILISKVVLARYREASDSVICLTAHMQLRTIYLLTFCTRNKRVPTIGYTNQKDATTSFKASIILML